jgi:hypothetical protein
VNSLSWMIYWAGVCDHMQGVFICISVAGFMASFIVGAAAAENGPKVLRYLKITAPVVVIGALLAAFTPSKNTLYAIAASEFGEEALKSPEATKARAALNAWLDKQIEPEKDK